jgi:hypothetical protein
VAERLDARLLLTLAVLAAGVGMVPSLVSSASADETGEPIQLDYRASPACPSRESFLARVRARTNLARFVSKAESEKPSRTIVVVAKEGPPAAGSMSVHGPEGDEEPRWIQGGSCENVADALALMVALTVDPQATEPATATSGSSTAAAAAPAPPASVAEVPPSVPAGPPVGTVASPRAPAPPVASAERPTNATRQIGSRPATHSLSAGADLAVGTGVAPQALLAPSLFVGWTPLGAWIVAPSIRAQFVRTDTGTLDVTGGGARFTWTAGRVDACGMFDATAALRVGPCARFEAGLLEVSGENVPAAQTQQSPWLAAGLVAHIEWTLIGPLFLDSEVGPLFHVTAHRFFFRPDTTAYKVPFLGMDADLGLGVQFR